MSLSDRRDELLNMLSPSAPTGVRTIAEKLFISEPTVRRDLKELAAEGLVIRTHGGVMLSSPAADKSLPLCSREFQMSEQKDSICRQAAEIVKNGDVVMLDNSTTALHMVPYLKNKKDIIVITNGIRLAEALCPENIKCLMTGGQVKTEAYGLIGADAVKFLSGYNADVCFFSCRGISPDGRLTDTSVGEDEIRAAMMARSKKSVLLADSSKFGLTFWHNLCHIGELDEVFSDADINISDYAKDNR